MPEPILGPRQAALVDAITTRLWSGLPMNEHDGAAAWWCADVLGLSPAAPEEPEVDPPDA